MGKRARKVETVQGWRDEHPDLTTGEHDTLVAMIELAWRDVQINLATVPESRREEALATKISAWEWLTKSPRAYKSQGMNPPRISFSAACLHLDLHEESTRWACFNRAWQVPHARLADPIGPPHGTMPDEWREVFFGPVEPERHREDRPYIKRRVLGPPNVPEAVLPEAQPLPPPSPPAIQAYCPVLDDAPEHYTLQDIIAIVQPSRPASDALSVWERALEGTEEDLPPNAR